VKCEIVPGILLQHTAIIQQFLWRRSGVIKRVLIPKDDIKAPKQHPLWEQGSIMASDVDRDVIIRNLADSDIHTTTWSLDVQYFFPVKLPVEGKMYIGS
jgi:hypothetical protein